jgi:hypothetical protein
MNLKIPTLSTAHDSLTPHPISPEPKPCDSPIPQECMDPSSAPADAIPLINRQVTCTEEHPLTETSFLERMDGILNRLHQYLSLVNQRLMIEEKTINNAHLTLKLEELQKKLIDRIEGFSIVYQMYLLPSELNLAIIRKIDLNKREIIINSPITSILQGLTHESGLLLDRELLVTNLNQPFAFLLRLREKFLELIDANMCPDTDSFCSSQKTTQILALGLAAAARNRPDLCPGNDLLYSLSSEMHRMLNGEMDDFSSCIDTFGQINNHDYYNLVILNHKNNTRLLLNRLPALYLNCLLIGYFNSQKHHPIDTQINNLQSFWKNSRINDMTTSGSSVFQDNVTHTIFLTYLLNKGFDISILENIIPNTQILLYIYALNGQYDQCINNNLFTVPEIACGFIDGEHKDYLNIFMNSMPDQCWHSFHSHHFQKISEIFGDDYAYQLIVNNLEKIIFNLFIQKNSFPQLPKEYLVRAHHQGLIKPLILKKSSSEKTLNDIAKNIARYFLDPTPTGIKLATEYALLISDACENDRKNLLSKINHYI